MVTGVAVLAGLVLVIWELQQTRALVTTEITQNRMNELSQDSTAVYGEQAAEVLAKACRNPASLTDSEKIILDLYFWNAMRRAFAAKRLSEIGAIEIDWKFVLRTQLEFVARYPAGEVWLTNVYRSVNSELAHATEEILPSVLSDGRSCLDALELFNDNANSAAA